MNEESAETALREPLHSLDFHHGETVSVDLPSAIWALAALEKPEDASG